MWATRPQVYDSMILKNMLSMNVNDCHIVIMFKDNNYRQNER